MKFYIKYINKSGEYRKNWVTATTEDEAKKIAEQSYWDIDTIVSISTDRNAI